MLLRGTHRIYRDSGQRPEWKLKHFKVARVRRGIPILGGLVILTIVRIMVNH